MLRAFADHVDVGVVDRAHVVVDHDGALDRQPAAQRRSRQLGLMPAEITTMSQSSVLPSLKARPVTSSVAQHRGGRLLEVDVDAHRLHALSSGWRRPAASSCCPSDGRRDGRRAPRSRGCMQAARGLEARAGRRRSPPRFCLPGACAMMPLQSSSVRKPKTPGLQLAVWHRTMPGHGRDEGAAAGGDQQLVVGLDGCRLRP